MAPFFRDWKNLLGIVGLLVWSLFLLSLNNRPLVPEAWAPSTAISIPLASDSSLLIPQYTKVCREAAYKCLGVARLNAATLCPSPRDNADVLFEGTTVAHSKHLNEQAKRRTTYWNEQIMGKMPAGVARVDGWLDHVDSAATGTLLKLQTDVLDIRGHVCEIGVHHGKYLIWMALHLRLGERAVGLDLFELAQSENIDGSGSGNLARMQANAARYAPPGVVEALATNSLRLPLCFFQEHGLQGLVRFFSVDGGHFVDHAYEDCWSAWSALAPGGIISVDDFVHGISVMQGVLRFLSSNSNARAFLVGSNKLYICHRAFYRTYFDAMVAVLPKGQGTAAFGDSNQLVMAPSRPYTLHGWLLPSVLESSRQGGVWNCGMLSRPYVPPNYTEVCSRS